jgi:hypothetical protein
VGCYCTEKGTGRRRTRAEAGRRGNLKRRDLNNFQRRELTLSRTNTRRNLKDE